MKVFLWLLTGLCVLVGVSGYIGYRVLESYIADAVGLNTELPKVVGVPPSYSRINHPSYSGLPPWRTPRPDDTTEYPIAWGDTGPATPLFAGPKQYPFLCQTIESELGQPNIDNQDKYGVPVFAEHENGKRTEQVIGYSKDCGLPTRLHYFVQAEQTSSSGKPVFKRHDDVMPPLSEDPDLLVRVETGTINRFIYVLMIPTGRNDSRDSPDLSRWNGKAVYHFKGAVGIGFQQGQSRFQRLLRLVAVAVRVFDHPPPPLPRPPAPARNTPPPLPCCALLPPPQRPEAVASRGSGVRGSGVRGSGVQGQWRPRQ